MKNGAENYLWILGLTPNSTLDSLLGGLNFKVYAMYRGARIGYM